MTLFQKGCRKGGANTHISYHLIIYQNRKSNLSHCCFYVIAIFFSFVHLIQTTQLHYVVEYSVQRLPQEHGRHRKQFIAIMELAL